MSKTCILVGGGKSVRTGISSNLWEEIKGQEIWSLNYAYKLMPYLPTRQCFVDYNFFRNNEDDLHDLASKGVPIHAKKNSKLNHIDSKFIKQYNTVRQKVFRGRTALVEPPEAHLFVGTMGLVGCFSLSLAIAEGYDIIYLLGYDFGVTSYTDKDTHWYQDKISVKSTGVGNPNVYWNKETIKKEVTDFDVYLQVPDLKIYNVSMLSNINAFPKITYQEFYKQVKDASKSN